MPDAEIVVVGGIAVDLIMQLPQLPAAGRCVIATAAHLGVGGKAANQAVAAARLGGRVALVGAVGNDSTGEMALHHLSAEGVSITNVRRDADAATATVVIQVDAARRKQVAVFPGANANVTEDLVEASAAVISAARVVAVQLEIATPAVRRTIEIARRSGAQVILDPSPVRPLPPERRQHGSSSSA